MTAKSIEEEDNLPMSEVLKLVNQGSNDVLRVIDALGLGRTSVKKDGIYRTFANGEAIKVAEGSFRNKRLSQKRFKLF